MNAPLPPAGLQPAVFLDRDGVINVDHGYVHRIDDFEFVDGVFDFCSAAHRKGYLLVVVTNQAGIGRGYYTEAQFHALTAWMREQFLQRGIPLAAVCHCPHHPEFGIGPYKKDCPRRKPNPGMILDAARELGIDLACSHLVGDKHSDLEAGERAGVKHLHLFDKRLAQPWPSV
jgi:D-glycero-D-manno-heptose 1,7-bisphosphate phosphatase